jgi:hypothetical protein
METAAQPILPDWLIQQRAHDDAIPRQTRTRSDLAVYCRRWIGRYLARRHIDSLDPRMARDIGAFQHNPMPEGYAVDPRPLWGIGLTPERRASEWNGVLS